jgi:ABC-2 type transport system ATP-binding protein
MNSQPVIAFVGVGKAFHHDLTRTKTVALHNLTFAVSPGEAFGIIGPNGAGKSTALKILMGFSGADHGMVRIKGQGPNQAQGHQMIGYLPENPCLYENLTITDHLRFAARTTDFSGPVVPRIKELLELVGLSGQARLPIRRFSKGMTQRAALAYALFHDPDLLVLDEPMSGLDPLGRQMVVDIIRDCHARGKTILFCSHILTDVERICDRIAIMNRGELQTITTPKELKNYVIAPELPPGTTPLEACFLEMVRDGKSPHQPQPAGEAA